MPILGISLVAIHQTLPRIITMSPQLFNILRTVLAALVSAIATFIIKYFDQFGESDYSSDYY